MRFGPVPVVDALGCILAHTRRVTVEGRTRVLKKGHRITEADLEALRSAGETTVMVAVLDSGDVHEDRAADRVGRALAGDSVTTEPSQTGRCNIYAERRGLLVLDERRLLTLNRVDESITVATLPPWTMVAPGDLVATVKVIPFAARNRVVERCAGLAESPTPPIAVAPLHAMRAGLILTRVPGIRDEVLDRGAENQRARVEYLGGSLVRQIRCDHETGAVSEAIRSLAADGLDTILVLGASAIVDRRDVVPASLEKAGGQIQHLGMPVDPGNLVLVGRLDDAAVVGVPGCARSLKPSGFDQILARLAAGLRVGFAEITAMGVGGLLKDVPHRPHPRRPRTREVPPRVGAVVLAAGRSTRMGERNKLLESVDGAPMIRRVLEALLASKGDPIVLVTGHQSDAVRAAVADLADDAQVEFVENPAFAEGMSTSLKAGLDALPEDVDGALFVLGDMPWVRTEDVDALIDAFDPQSEVTLCVPVHDRKRGNPILWGARHFPALRALSGDRGARRLLDAHADEIRLVEVGNPGIHVDVDTPEALDRARQG